MQIYVFNDTLCHVYNNTLTSRITFCIFNDLLNCNGFTEILINVTNLKNISV